MYFRVTVTGDSNRYPTWGLYGDNQELVAWAGEGFDSQSNATRAATAFKSGATVARYEAFQDSGGSWRWRAWRSSGKVAASGEAFASRLNAERAAENVRIYSPHATGP